MIKTIEIDNDLKDIIISALRYALYRHTYILQNTCEYLKKHIEIIDKRVQKVMLEDIKKRLEDKDLKDYEIAEIKSLQVVLEKLEGVIRI